MELCPLWEVQRLQLDDTVLLRAVRHVDAFVDSQSVDLAKLVVDVSTQRTDSIGAERHRFGRLMVELFVNFRTFHEVDFPFSALETEPDTGGRLLICNSAEFASFQDVFYCWLHLVMDVPTCNGCILLLVLTYKTLCTTQRTSAVHHTGSYSA